MKKEAVVLEPEALERLVRIGGQGFLLEMIALFLEHAPQRLAAAREGLEEGDFAVLYRASHSLKSTAGNLGARALQATAEQVEGRAVAEDLDAAVPLLEEMEARYDQVRAELEAEQDRRTQ